MQGVYKLGLFDCIFSLLWNIVFLMSCSAPPAFVMNIWRATCLRVDIHYPYCLPHLTCILIFWTWCVDIAYGAMMSSRTRNASITVIFSWIHFKKRIFIVWNIFYPLLCRFIQVCSAYNEERVPLESDDLYNSICIASNVRPQLMDNNCIFCCLNQFFVLDSYLRGICDMKSTCYLNRYWLPDGYLS